MQRAVLWDLDGTLADTEEVHFHAWREILAGYGVDHSYDEFLAGFGRSNRELLPVLLGPDLPLTELERISVEKEVIFRRRLQQSQEAHLLPGVRTWLEEFAAAGHRQAIGSSAPMANIVAIINRLGVGDYFQNVMSGLPLPNGKPHPAIFLQSAAALDVPAARCLVMEDSTHGIEAARRAGMASVAVGKIATAPELDRLLDRVPGPACLRLNSLEELSWEQVHIQHGDDLDGDDL